MINTIKLKFGSHETQPPLSIAVKPITVFVGPNNSGKSRVLIEIESYCRRTMGQPSDVILGQLEFESLSKYEIESEISKIEQTPKIGETINPGHVILGKLNPQNNSMFRAQINKEGLINEAQNPNQRQGFYSTFLNIP